MAAVTVEAAGPVALLLEAAVADFRAVEEHGAGNRFGARPLDGVEGGHNDRLPPQVLDQALASTMPLSVCMASSVSNWTACR